MIIVFKLRISYLNDGDIKCHKRFDLSSSLYSN